MAVNVAIYTVVRGMAIRCSAPDCDRTPHGTYCSTHKWRLRKYGVLEPEFPAPRRNHSTPEHFWSRMDKSGECWVFQGATNSKGYGWLTYQGKLWSAHRLAFFLHHGCMPVNMVLHHCDNPPCCNPNHIYDGTASQNSIDMYSRGRANPTGTRWLRKSR